MDVSDDLVLPGPDVGHDLRNVEADHESFRDSEDRGRPLCPETRRLVPVLTTRGKDSGE